MGTLIAGLPLEGHEQRDEDRVLPTSCPTFSPALERDLSTTSSSEDHIRRQTEVFSQTSSFISTQPSSAFSLREHLKEDNDDIDFPDYSSLRLSHPIRNQSTSQNTYAPDESTVPEISVAPDESTSDLSQPLWACPDDTAVKEEPSRHVDYLSHDWREEDIWASWRYIVSQRRVYGQMSRLENASWRTWAKQRSRLRTVPPGGLNWLKESDVTWLYGPLKPAQSYPITNDAAISPFNLSKSGSFINKKPILKKRNLSDVMLQKSLSASSLVKKAAASVQAQKNTLRNRSERIVFGFYSTPSTPSSLPPSREDHDSSRGGSTADSNDDVPQQPQTKHVRWTDSHGNPLEHLIDDLEDPTRQNRNGRATPPDVMEEAQHHVFDKNWSARKASLSRSQETLRPGRASMNFLLADDHDDDLGDEMPTSWLFSASNRKPSSKAAEAESPEVKQQIGPKGKPLSEPPGVLSVADEPFATHANTPQTSDPVPSFESETVTGETKQHRTSDEKSTPHVQDTLPLDSDTQQQASAFPSRVTDTSRVPSPTFLLNVPTQDQSTSTFGNAVTKTVKHTLKPYLGMTMAPYVGLLLSVLLCVSGIIMERVMFRTEIVEPVRAPRPFCFDSGIRDNMISLAECPELVHAVDFSAWAGGTPPYLRLLTSVSRSIIPFTPAVIVLAVSLRWRRAFRRRSETEASQARVDFSPGYLNVLAGRWLNILHSWLRDHHMSAWKDMSKMRFSLWRACKASTLLRFLRPKSQRGYCRIEWTCSCGRPMYGDYTDSGNGNLARKLSELFSQSTLQSSIQSSPLEATNSPRELQSTNDGSSTPRSSSPSSSLSTTSDNSDSSQVSSSTSISSPSCETVPVQSYLELCVNRDKYLTRVGEIPIVDAKGDYLVKSDFELFAKIKCRYNELGRRGILRYCYRPRDVRFVYFGIRRGINQAGIYNKERDEIPPVTEVEEGRYHYYECPLPQMPPIDTRTFFHYFWDHASHAPTSDMTFYDRIPKKLGCSILMASSSTPLTMGWGVHIIEGVNWPLFPWIVVVILAVTLVVATVYDALSKGQESGFTIGQLVFSLLMAILSSLISYIVDTV